MNYDNMMRNQAEEENLFICDIADEALETAADTRRETGANLTWLHCPTGLSICRAIQSPPSDVGPNCFLSAAI
jgi:hypothetical protein